MIVFDLPTESGAERVAGIGSCRINEPLGQALVRKSIPYLWSDMVFAHATTEAELNIRLTFEQPHLSPILRRLVYYPPHDVVQEPPPGDLASTIDTFLVEVSETQLFTVDGWPVQMNRLFAEIVQKHPVALHFWWDEVCRQGRPSPERVEQAVQALRDEGADDLPEMEFVLRNVVHTRQTQDQLSAGVQALTRKYPGRWIFVSHFSLPNDMRTEPRRELAGWLSAAAAQVGAAYFDPSGFVQEMGIERALKGGVDIHHYSDASVEVMGEAYFSLLRGETPVLTPAGALP